MALLTLLTALLLSGIAAYYSIVGLTAIFVGAFWPIVLMGGTLEVAKLVTTSWLYRNWYISPKFLKYYLTSAVLILMLITSMGIFGFLSKAHIDSTLNANSNSTELKVLNAQEKIAKERLDYLLARAKDPSTASNKLDKQIQDTQKELKTISDKKLPILKQEVKFTADVGPVKYVAEMIYGNEEGSVDRAVRLVILIIMVVFDPLAVLLLIAGNISLVQKKTNKQEYMPEQDNDVIPVEKNNVTTMQEKTEEKSNEFVVKQIVPGLYTEEWVQK